MFIKRYDRLLHLSPISIRCTIFASKNLARYPSPMKWCLLRQKHFSAVRFAFQTSAFIFSIPSAQQTVSQNTKSISFNIISQQNTHHTSNNHPAISRQSDAIVCLFFRYCCMSTNITSHLDMMHSISIYIVGTIIVDDIDSSNCPDQLSAHDAKINQWDILRFGYSPMAINGPQCKNRFSDNAIESFIFS